MNDTRELLKTHIMTAIPRASQVFPGAFIVALGSGPSLAVFGPSTLALPETYTFKAANGQEVTVPVQLVPQKGVNQELVDSLTRKVDTAEGERKAA